MYRVVLGVASYTQNNPVHIISLALLEFYLQLLNLFVNFSNCYCMVIASHSCASVSDTSRRVLSCLHLLATTLLILMKFLI